MVTLLAKTDVKLANVDDTESTTKSLAPPSCDGSILLSSGAHNLCRDNKGVKQAHLVKHSAENLEKRHPFPKIKRK